MKLTDFFIEFCSEFTGAANKVAALKFSLFLCKGTENSESLTNGVKFFASRFVISIGLGLNLIKIVDVFLGISSIK